LRLVHEGDVAAGHACAGDGNEAEERPIADEEGGDDADEDGHTRFEFHGGEENEAGAEIAEGDAREDSVETHGVEMKVREAVDDDAEKKQDDRAAKGVEKERLARRSAGEPGSGGEDGGDTDQKEEGGEDEIGGSEAVPHCVFKRPVGAAAVAVVVDENHKADGEAAQEIE